MPDHQKLKISESEWHIMEVVWSSAAPIAMEDIQKALPVSLKWSTSTLCSLLNRLGKKEALANQREGRRYLYSATCPREDCLVEESNAFLGRFFGGRLSPMMAHFLGNEEISDEELDRLEALLQKKRKERGHS